PHDPRSILFPYTTLFRSNQPTIKMIAKAMTFGIAAKNIAMPPASAVNIASDQSRTAGNIAVSLSQKVECAKKREQGSFPWPRARSEEHTSELQSLAYLVC